MHALSCKHTYMSPLILMLSYCSNQQVWRELTSILNILLDALTVPTIQIRDFICLFSQDSFVNESTSTFRAVGHSKCL